MTAPSGYEKTSNRMGWINEANRDPIVDAFLEFASSAKLRVLDVGAGHGATVRAAVELGAEVVAVETHPDHVQRIRDQVADSQQHRLTVVNASFPEEFELEAQSVSGALVARVFHFFEGPMIEASARKLHDMLAIGGKVFVSAETPFRNNMREFLPSYEARKQAGDPWPGVVRDTSAYFPEEANLPSFMNFLDPEVLARSFSHAGFEVEEVGTFERSHLPPQVKLDGREGVGLVALRPA